MSEPVRTREEVEALLAKRPKGLRAMKANELELVLLEIGYPRYQCTRQQIISRILAYYRSLEQSLQWLDDRDAMVAKVADMLGVKITAKLEAFANKNGLIALNDVLLAARKVKEFKAKM